MMTKWCPYQANDTALRLISNVKMIEISESKGDALAVTTIAKGMHELSQLNACVEDECAMWSSTSQRCGLRRV